MDDLFLQYLPSARIYIISCSGQSDKKVRIFGRRVRTVQNPDPILHPAFIHLLNNHNWFALLIMILELSAPLLLQHEAYYKPVNRLISQ